MSVIKVNEIRKFSGTEIEISNPVKFGDGATVDGAFEATGANNLSHGMFTKSDYTKVAWKKTAVFSVSTDQELKVEVGGRVFTIADNTAVSMPTAPAVGTDCTIWINPNGTLQASASFSTPTSTGARKLGGFHYAGGSNATFAVNAGDGNTTPQINAFSFYDLRFKPSARDPRGLTLCGGAFWAGIYHLAAAHLTGPPHRNGTNPARDGATIPNINGTGNYPNASPMNLFEILAFHGFRPPSVFDFQLLTYGTTEAASRGNDPLTTGLGTSNEGSSNADQKFTSTWGVIQSTGVLWHWTNDPSILETTDQTLPNPARGGRFRISRFGFLGGFWGNAAISGSRSVANFTATIAGSSVGARGVCDHVILE